MSRNVQFSEGEFYHIYNRGVEKRKIFLDQEDYQRFIRLLYVANSSKSVHLSNFKDALLLEIPKGDSVTAIGAWCLMTNHFHLLLKETKENGISEFMQKLLTGYTMYFNKKYKRKGVLFEGVFSAKHLDTDNYLKYQYAYIHLNPISIVDSGWKEKKVTDHKKALDFLNSYKYSSFYDYSGNEREEKVIISTKVFPEYFETLNDFKDMIKEWINFDSDSRSFIKAKP